jgi:hypothetical protein
VAKTTGTARRRGKRGGQRHRSRCPPQPSHEEHKSESIEDLCKRLFALNVKDSKTRELLCEASKEDVVDSARLSATNSAASVRHHWGPPFRPDSQPELPYLSVRKGKTTTRLEPLQKPEQPLVSPSSPAAQNAPQLWLDKPQGLPLFGPFASMEPQWRQGSTTVGQQLCKISQACSSQHVVSPFYPEDPLREAIAATHRALLMDRPKSASQTVPSQGMTETETPAIVPHETAIADTDSASTRGVSCSRPTCVTCAKTGGSHDCVCDYIDSDRAYPPSPNKTKDPRTHLWNALPANRMAPVAPDLPAHKSSNTTCSDKPSLLTKSLDVGLNCPVPVIAGLRAYTPVTLTGHVEPHYAPLTPAQASRNLLSRRHGTITPIKTDVKKDVDAMLARHNSRGNATTTVHAPPWHLPSQVPMMSLPASPIQTMG